MVKPLVRNKRRDALPHITDWMQCRQVPISAQDYCPTMSSCMLESRLMTVA